MSAVADGGEAILEALRSLNVEYIISSPGSEWAPVWEALADQKLSNRAGPTYIDCGHELLAVNMALGYTLATGRMQAVLLHAGTGLLQGSMGIHSAAVTEVPMLVMSGESQSYGDDPRYEPGVQWYRSLGVVGGPGRLIDPLVKAANHVTNPYTIYQSVIHSAELAQRVPRGPIYLSIGLEAMLHAWTPETKPKPVLPAPKTQALPQDVEAVATLLLQAKNPIIVTESAGRDPAAFDALVRLAEALAIPVAEAASGIHGNFPRDNPLYIGTKIGATLKQADVVLAVSCRVPWYPPSRAATEAKIVVIGENPLKAHMVYQNLQADLYLEGDLASSLNALADKVAASPRESGPIEERRRRWRSVHIAHREKLRGEQENASPKAPVDPLLLCSVLRQIVPDDGIFIDDTVIYGTTLYEHLQWTKPQSFYRVPTGLGQGFGVALGVKLAARDRPVVLLTGDGSFLYNPVLAALAASRTYRLPLLVIVFNNGEYRSMKRNHLGFYPEGTSAKANLFFGVTIEGIDYSEVAKPYGFYGRRVSDPTQLLDAVREGMNALERGRTAIIDVVVK
ncbi:MAG TPA: thiamine pyrophosphate-binding protein [Beijerinckiaceae bacterium]|nr:thiamine pyrophosphate-binding protein [Beijerinckiaceae bacterium]